MDLSGIAIGLLVAYLTGGAITVISRFLILALHRELWLMADSLGILITFLFWPLCIGELPNLISDPKKKNKPPR